MYSQYMYVLHKTVSRAIWRQQNWNRNSLSFVWRPTLLHHYKQCVRDFSGSKTIWLTPNKKFVNICIWWELSNLRAYLPLPHHSPITCPRSKGTWRVSNRMCWNKCERQTRHVVNNLEALLCLCWKVLVCAVCGRRKCRGDGCTSVKSAKMNLLFISQHIIIFFVIFILTFIADGMCFGNVSWLCLCCANVNEPNVIFSLFYGKRAICFSYVFLPFLAGSLVLGANKYKSIPRVPCVVSLRIRVLSFRSVRMMMRARKWQWQWGWNEWGSARCERENTKAISIVLLHCVKIKLQVSSPAISEI